MMRIVEQKNSLSEEDLVHLQGSPIIVKMLKQRLVVEFEQSPEIEEIDFSGTRGFYLIKSLGHKIYQFWFEDNAVWYLLKERCSAVRAQYLNTIMLTKKKNVLNIIICKNVFFKNVFEKPFQKNVF